MSIGDRRRQEIAESAIQLISQNGLDTLSFRAIAAEMGCSTGVLTHHFRDKAALIDHVIDTIIADIESTARQRADADLETLLLHLLPHDAETTAQWQALFSFTAASLTEPALKGANARREQALHALLTSLLTRHRPTQQDRATDDGIDADLLLSMLDGLALRILLDPARFTRRRAGDLVRRYLAAMRPPTGPAD